MLDWETNNSTLVTWTLRTMAMKVPISIPYMVEAKPLQEEESRSIAAGKAVKIQLRHMPLLSLFIDGSAPPNVGKTSLDFLARIVTNGEG